MAWLLGLQQLRERYLGTMAGALWVVLHPVLLLSVFWVVFEKGLKIGGTGSTPFVPQLFAGLIAWMTFAEALSNGALAITSRQYLIKKISFPAEALPLSHVLCATLTHGILVAVLVLVCLWYGVGLRSGLLLFPYYFLGLSVLALGISMLTSAVNVFFRDVSQALTVLLNIWFWITPIVWPSEILPPSFQILIDLNPLAYLINGYRAAFLSQDLIPPPLMLTCWFWGVTFFVFVLGWVVFSRFKHDFVDVL